MSKPNVIPTPSKTLTAVLVALTVFLMLAPATFGQTEAEKGKQLFQQKTCAACHTIGGGKLAGPDLAGVTERREEEWLKKWLKSPDTMVMSDPIAKEMLGVYMVPMPNLGLTDEEIDALIEYFESVDEAKK
ncbi:MAG: c-type cytochrome [Candidatus Dadabacteria bacterium]|jgi:mono/diheme cytochrome c family protein|nr:c-type cytochrome [Candidatus Dadabacteria bacterium]